MASVISINAGFAVFSHPSGSVESRFIIAVLCPLAATALAYGSTA